jgi:hypothetical protein
VVWLWVVLALAVVGVAAYLLIRSRRSPEKAWHEDAVRAVSLGTSLFQDLAADLATASVHGPPAGGFPERSRAIDVLAGQLATLAAGQGEPAAATPLAGLRDDLDGLRSAVRAFEGAQVVPQDAVQQASQRLALFETSLQRFAGSIGPPSEPA